MQTKQHERYGLPAEWEAQDGVMLTWPHAATDWAPYLEDITDTYLALADIITRYEHLVVATPHVDATRRLLATRLTEAQMARVHLYEAESNDTWARDHGPLTLVKRNHESQTLEGCDYQAGHAAGFQILDFRFNGWGEKFEWQKDNAITRRLYEAGAFRETSLESHADFVLEGGSIESDGQGTILTTSHCLLAAHRNQPLQKEDIEHQLLSYFHARRILWLDHGQLIGDDTDGHIDTIVRMAPRDTILYIGCDDPADEQYADLQALEQQLLSLHTSEGHPYRLLRLPTPHAIYDDGKELNTEGRGERLPATYANFLVVNGAVIYPTYGQPEKDAEAGRIIQQAFPDREIIPLDSQTIVRQHGSIHCLTMQLPEGCCRELTGICGS